MISDPKCWESGVTRTQARKEYTMESHSITQDLYFSLEKYTISAQNLFNLTNHQQQAMYHMKLRSTFSQAQHIT
jgi:hypothetical protein